MLSSRIEGTQATLAEVLEFEADAEASTLPQERRDDIREVQNYRHAMRQAVELLNTLPLSLRVIKTFLLYTSLRCRRTYACTSPCAPATEPKNHIQK